MSIDHISPSLSCRLNSVPSDGNFQKSCEMVLAKSKRLEARFLHSILAYDDSENPSIDDGEHMYMWYLAIGSMINPVSLYLRDLTPLLSYPAKCPNHRLVFRDPGGMADIKSCQGEEFDGVVHLLSMEQMVRLDQVEHMYRRVIVRIIDYQQRSHLVHVYQMTLIGQEERPIGIPSERYLDIIVKGCEHFGVHPSYINRLRHEQPVIPRKLPSAYETIGRIPDHVYYTKEDLLKHDGKDSKSSLWISINGKILEYTGLPATDHPDHENQKRFYEFVLSYFAGRDVVYVISRTWYEPIYNLPFHEDDLCAEHRAFAEDMCVSWGLDTNESDRKSYWKPIGKIRPVPNADPV